MNAYINWTVTVDGKDVSSPMRPYLMSVEIDDQPGVTADTARLRFDDSDGQIRLPPVGGSIDIAGNGVTLFSGVVDSTPFTLSRREGRTLDIIATSVDLRGKGKERQQWHLDDTTLGAALEEAAKEAGYEIQVDPALASSFREYWSPDGSSFLAYAAHLARQYGATFKVAGKRAVFAKRGTGLAVTGVDMPTVQAIVGRNVIAAQIDPTVSRHRYGRAEATWFDRETATYQRKSIELSDPANGTVNRSGKAFDSESSALDFLERQRVEDARTTASGTIEMEFAPEARTEGTVVLSGARPGIDGTYRIISVMHRADRTSGTTTTLTVAQAQGEAGKDNRRATGSGGARTTKVPVPTPAPR